MVHTLRPAAAAAQQVLAAVLAVVSVLAEASVPPGAEVLALAEAEVPAEPEVEVSVRELVPTEAAALAPVEADPLVEELILSEVEPLARELAQERELAAVGVHQAARVELAQEQAPIAQGLP